MRSAEASCAAPLAAPRRNASPATSPTRPRHPPPHPPSFRVVPRQQQHWSPLHRPPRRYDAATPPCPITRLRRPTLRAWTCSARRPRPRRRSTSALPDGFVLGDGAVTIDGGAGALLVGGEGVCLAAVGRLAPQQRTGSVLPPRRLVNARGQWDLAARVDEAFALLDDRVAAAWCSPSRPKKNTHIHSVHTHTLSLSLSLSQRLADSGHPVPRPAHPRSRTRCGRSVPPSRSTSLASACASRRPTHQRHAAQFNLLATERGVDQVAAAAILGSAGRRAAAPCADHAGCGS